MRASGALADLAPPPTGEKGSIVSYPLDEEAGLDLFEETATAAGTFPHAIRGYDRGSVDAYVKEVEAKLARALDELREAHYRLAAANAVADHTDYARLGSHTRTLLTAAEAQAAEIVQAARAEADRIRAESAAERTRLTHEAHHDLDVAGAASSADLDLLRQRLGEQTAAELDAAKAEIAALRAAAQHDAAAQVEQARLQAQAMIEAASAEAARLTTEAETRAAEQSAELARARAEALAETAAARDRARSEIDTMVAVAQQQAGEYRARMDADAVTADQRREAARAEAAGIVGAGQQEAERVIEAARHEAARIIFEANEAASGQVETLQREIKTLTMRRQAVVDQLEALSASVAGTARTAPADQPVHHEERDAQPEADGS